MQLQSILRRVQPLPGFVYTDVLFQQTRAGTQIQIGVRPRRRCKPVCSGCQQKRPGYDTLEPRHFAFVPLWGVAVFLIYAMRRVDCKTCGVVVESVPWATGKSPMTHAYTWFLASWAKVLSWQETARRFRTTWDTVFRAVELAVRWGLEHRNLDGIRAIGVDELAWKKGHKYLTLVYQIDHGSRRLLHIARDRTAESFRSFFDMLGPERSHRIAFVASDMWKAFLRVVRERCSVAVHVLDRFHVMQLMSKAIDQTRRLEVRALRASGRHVLLTKTRWLLLKRPKNLTRDERGRLRALREHVGINLRTLRAYLLKEQFQHFWTYRSVPGARRFLDTWTRMAMRSRIDPIKKFARTLRQHRRELLNWFLARGQFAAGATEGFNNKARITTRKAYGFRTYKHAEIALYHALGDLPEPDWLTHRFA
ncbi:MAG: ISL3 family transposase [Pseudonocardiaceae bacterium]